MRPMTLLSLLLELLRLAWRTFLCLTDCSDNVPQCSCEALSQVSTLRIRSSRER